MKQFDDIFSRKVKEAFDNYNADHLAEDGWNAFAGKQGRKRRRALIIPLWAKAASIAVLLTAGLLYTGHVTRRTADDVNNISAKENQTELTQTTVNEEGAGEESQVIASTTPVDDVTIAKAEQVKSSVIINTDHAISNPVDPLLIEPARTTAADVDMSFSANPIETRLIVDADMGLKLKKIEPGPVSDDFIREKRQTSIMTGFSGMMASIDDATSIAQGISLGFYVERQLTRRIAVRPGLAMSRHSYAVESMPGTSGDALALNYAAPELGGLSGTTTSYDANIDIVSIEVPVNFVFSLRKRQGSNLFVTTGASTVIYLDQHITSNFTNTYTRSTVDSNSGEVSYESMTTAVEINTDEEPFDRVDFMGLANFSAGYSIPFGKTTHLLFEPFVQLPIRDLTSLNLRIRYGGLSMKIQF